MEAPHFLTLFSICPFEYQSGGNAPNPFQGVINQTPKTPCAYDPSGPPGCVDWSSFRPALLFGEFQPHLKSQYSEQYNLTIERQITKDMVFRIGYVGTQSHHLLASHDLNYGNADSCLEIAAIASANPNNVLASNGGPQTTCGSFSSDSSYYIAPGTVVPAYTPPRSLSRSNTRLAPAWFCRTTPEAAEIVSRPAPSSARTA